MTISDTYKYLKEPRRIEWVIRKYTYQHDALQASLLPSAIRYDKDAVQTSPEDTLSDVASSVLELEKKIRDLECRRANILLTITAAIDRLPDEREAAILSAYYVRRIPMEKVAEQVHWSREHTYRLRKSGVKHLSEIL